MSLKDWSTVLTSFFQIGFFVLIGTVTVLTYAKAKKTFLQPFKAEVFKEQLKALSAVQSRFAGKGELDIRGELGWEKFVFGNAFRLLDDFAEIFHRLDVDRATRPYRSAEFPMGVSTYEGIGRYATLCDGHLKDDRTRGKDKRSDVRWPPESWDAYALYDIRIPREWAEADQSLRALMESPLLPARCLELLDSYKKVVWSQVDILRELLNECAWELPSKYPDVETLENCSCDWIRHSFNQRAPSLKEEADAITSYVRDYYAADALLE